MRDRIVTQKVESLAIGKVVTCSPQSQNPEYANDGLINVSDYWECNAKDSWWQVDLGATKDISTINVIPLYTGNRYYGFLVKTSIDGTNWTIQIDKRDNKECFGARGCEESFQITPMRYIRVEMFGSNLNPGNHLVELIAK